MYKYITKKMQSNVTENTQLQRESLVNKRPGFCRFHSSKPEVPKHLSKHGIKPLTLAMGSISYLKHYGNDRGVFAIPRLL